jgi:hypothetical protein
MAETLSSLRTRVRARADMKNSNFVEDSELNQYINSSYQELYDILVTSFEDYYTLPPVAFSIASGSNYYELPSDFYKLRGVDSSLDGSNYYTMQPFDFANRNKFNQSLLVMNSANYYKQYRIVGDRLYITPEDDAAGNYRIWYVPKAVTLGSDSDTLDGINGWEEYIVVDATRKCLAKEESDTSFLVQEKEMLRQRIIAAAARRDAGMPKSITDVNSSFDVSYVRTRLF